MANNTLEKPCIFVYANNPEESLLREILAGIEEESIPYEVRNVDFNENTILNNTYNAAQQSRMGIAIGIVNNRIVLQHNKLREERPLIDIKLNFYHKENARKIGCNAARLYKIMPFKNLDNSDNELIEKIRKAVISVLNQRKLGF